jgi:hypothetical protein
MRSESDILDLQAQAFHQAQTGAIAQAGHEMMHAGKLCQPGVAAWRVRDDRGVETPVSARGSRGRVMRSRRHFASPSRSDSRWPDASERHGAPRRPSPWDGVYGGTGESVRSSARPPVRCGDAHVCGDAPGASDRAVLFLTPWSLLSYDAPHISGRGMQRSSACLCGAAVCLMRQAIVLFLLSMHASPID